MLGIVASRAWSIGGSGEAGSDGALENDNRMSDSIPMTDPVLSALRVCPSRLLRHIYHTSRNVFGFAGTYHQCASILEACGYALASVHRDQVEVRHREWKAASLAAIAHRCDCAGCGQIQNGQTFPRNAPG